jgi:quercetin dioxygenase-like cupin family protein
MRSRRFLATVLMLAAIFQFAQPARAHVHEEVVVRPLMQLPLPDYPGKEGLVLRVEYPPGHIEAPHRHDAHVFVYVLEGSVEMQMGNGKSVILNAGDTFYEDPREIHRSGRNLSTTRPATLIVFFVKDVNKPPVLPAGN